MASGALQSKNHIKTEWKKNKENHYNLLVYVRLGYIRLGYVLWNKNTKAQEQNEKKK